MNESVPYLVVTALFVLVLLAFILAIGIREHKKQLEKQRIGLQWLSSLRIVLSCFQQHRGLTTGFLNGGKEMLREIDPLQKKILRQIQEVAAIDGWIEDNSRWRGILDHWSRLEKSYQENTVENNLEQHNRLIRNLLLLIDDMAQEHGLLLLKSHDDQPLHLLWRELLTTAELIGQARAIGTGVSAAEHCDSIARIRLNYLCQNIEEKMQQVWRDIPPDSQQRSLIENFLKCVQEDVIHEHPSIKPSQYFKIASEVLDGLYDQYDRFISLHLGRAG